MPTYELMDKNDRNNPYHFGAFNNEGSLAYVYRKDSNYRPEYTAEHGFVFKIFRISVCGRIVHEICQIDTPCFEEPRFDIQNEEVCWLGRVPHPSWENVTGLEDAERCLLTFVTFGLLTGTFNRYYHLRNVNCKWRLMHKVDDLLLAHHTDPSSGALRVYAVSCLDPVNGTFGLCPYINLPFYDNLLSTYGFTKYLASSKGQITVCQFSLPNEILYFKLNGCWTMENVTYETTDDNLQVMSTYCKGPIIFQTIKRNGKVAFRCLKIDEKEVWELVACFPRPDSGYSFRFSSDGRLIGYVKSKNPTLDATILSCYPCTLLKSCITVLWPSSRQTNPGLTDIEICDRLGLSKYVNMDTYFGKQFLN